MMAMLSISALNAIPWTIAFLSFLVAVVSLAISTNRESRKESKADATSMATVMSELKTIKESMGRLNSTMVVIQNDIKGFEHRVTVLETQAGGR